MCFVNNFLQVWRYRGSYMSAHVLLNLLNELGKKIRCEALPSILSVFPNEFNKFNNTGARMQDSICHMTLDSHFISKFALNLLNELGKKIRCEALPSILSVFPNEFNKFNNTGAQMQDSICHMALNSHFISKFFTEFIKRVGEKDKMRGFANHLIGFPQRV